jgi:hypothetical protein
MQDIVFYAVANETLGAVRDHANARKMPAPVLTLGVSACLRMRLFSALDTADPYPLAAFNGIADWQWRMDSDFDRNSTCKLVADANGISVRSVTDAVNGETAEFTEFAIPISNMNTQELAEWLGGEPKRSGLTGELVGYDSEERAVFILQIDNFTVRNRVAGLEDPTAVDQELVTRTMAEHLIQTAVSASADTKQDKLTSANAGAGISISADGVIGTANIPQSAVTGLSASLAAKQESITAGYRMELIGGSTVGQQRHFQIETPSGSAVTLQAGHAYRINATTGQKTLNAEAMNVNEFGLEGHLELFVANAGYIQTGENVVLATPLTPDAMNNCTVRFHNGKAVISVEDHVAGHAVTSDAPSGENTLSYWIAQPNADDIFKQYISFDASLNGTTIDLSGSTANGEKHVVGNGYTETTLTGSVDCGTSKFTVANLSLQNVVVNGGTLTLGDAYIPSGSTVSVSGGGLAVEKATGDGAIFGGRIDLQANALLQGQELSGYNNGNRGVVLASYKKGCIVSNCHIHGNTTSYMGAGAFIAGSTVSFVGCLFEDNLSTSATIGNCICIENTGSYAAVELSGCTLSTGQNVRMSNNASRSAAVVFSDYNKILARVTATSGSNCLVTISSGAIVDLTGNENEEPVKPNGGVVIGSAVHIYPSAGSASAVEISGGTYKSITNGGVLKGLVAVGDEIRGGTNAVIDMNASHYVFNTGAGVVTSIGGCLITGGTNAGATPDGIGGAFYNSTGTLRLSGCIVSGNLGRVGGGIDTSDRVEAVDCVISGNTITGTNRAGKDIYVAGSGALVCSNSEVGEVVGAGGQVILAGGSNRIGSITSRGTGYGTISVIISSGATLDLTGNANAMPVNPGGGIAIFGGPMTSGTIIIGSAGDITQKREFEDVEIHGASISKTGAVYGATVTIPDSKIYHVRYAAESGSASSSVTITGPTAYVLAEELSSQAGLTGVVNI